MKTLLRILLFIGLKIGELIGVVCVIAALIGLCFFLSKTADWFKYACLFILLGAHALLMAVGIYLLIKANWRFVKRIIK